MLVPDCRCRAGKHAGADSFRDYSQRLFAALVSLMQYLADTEETLPNIVFWLLGSFATSWHKVAMALPILVSATLLIALRWRINLLALEETMRAVSASVTALRAALLCCAVLVAAQVAVSGSIAWVGW
jgi:iron complex transport system permease protein